MEDDLVTSELASGVLKRCPKCGILTYKIDGCNYIKCGVSLCGAEWCWLCVQCKGGNGCTNKDHNSHYTDLLSLAFIVCTV